MSINSDPISNVADQEREADDQELHHSAQRDWDFCETSMQLTTACNARILDPNEECYHGTITGAEAIKRLKATNCNSHLVRYSERQHKYILTVLKKGLGQDKDNDLVNEFEIIIGKKHCSISGISTKHRSLTELLAHHKKESLHPSIANIGEKCISSRFMKHPEACPEFGVQGVHRATEIHNQELQRHMREMEAKIQHLEDRSCIIS